MIIHTDTEVINSYNEINNEDNICKICYDTLKPEDNISLLKCQHKFHYDCIMLHPIKL